MPAEVGSGSFWTGMVEYMQDGPDSLDGVLDDIEASWPQLSRPAGRPRTGSGRVRPLPAGPAQGRRER